MIDGPRDSVGKQLKSGVGFPILIIEMAESSVVATALGWGCGDNNLVIRYGVAKLSLNLITITGTVEQLRALVQDPVSEAEINDEAARRVSGGFLEVGAYASDKAIAELRSRGLTVEVQMNDAELTSHLNELKSQATRGPDDTGEV
ncbi:MAG: hypothetical protein LC776_15565 [Acidobacteria bacterium]|nr:hypothetical protein [Acidobacteriota bacterium]